MGRGEPTDAGGVAVGDRGYVHVQWGWPARAEKDSTGTTNHVWDGQNILLETNASNIIQVVYTLEPLLYGNLISQSRSGVDSFYLFDALGSTRIWRAARGRLQ